MRNIGMSTFSIFSQHWQHLLNIANLVKIFDSILADSIGRALAWNTTSLATLAENLNYWLNIENWQYWVSLGGHHSLIISIEGNMEFLPQYQQYLPNIGCMSINRLSIPTLSEYWDHRLNIDNSYPMWTDIRTILNNNFQTILADCEY